MSSRDARVNRVQHRPEDITAYGRWGDHPRKPWTAACDCGYISWHTSANAAKRALSNHTRRPRDD